MKILYTAEGTTRAGRNGHTGTPDQAIDLQLAKPKEMGGTGNGVNPEQLFACGYSACFGSAIEAVARQKKLTVKEIEVTAHVAIGNPAEHEFALAVELDVHLPELSKSEAEELVQAAHEVCPYSKAIRNNVEVKLKVI